MEVVPFRDHPPNAENPYAALSASERYERLMKRLAEIWSAISRRWSANAPKQEDRKKAA